MRGISWLAANQLASQEGLCTMEWVISQTLCDTHRCKRRGCRTYWQDYVSAVGHRTAGHILYITTWPAALILEPVHTVYTRLFLREISLSESANACLYIGFRFKLKWGKKNQTKNQTSNLFLKKKLQEKRTLLISYVILCELRLIKNQSRKLTVVIKRGKAGMADRWCHCWLRSRLSYVLLVGFFCECFIERLQVLRSCTVGDVWVIEQGALVEWYWEGETEVIRGKGAGIFSPTINPIWILLGSKLITRCDRWATKDCCFQCHLAI